MSISLKIINGTREGSRSLCLSCLDGMVRRGDKDEIITCKKEYYRPRDLQFQVIECSGYYPANLPSIGDMYKTAWILQPSKGNREMGFVPYNKWRETVNGDDYEAHKAPENPFL